MPEAAEKVEISQEDLKVLQAAYTTLNGLWTSPKHGLALKKMVKDVKPDTVIPELDVAERVTEPLVKELEETKGLLAKTRDEIEADKKARKEEKDLSDVYTKIDAVVKKRSLTDEGRSGLIKVMQDRQIADPEAAALVYLDGLPKTPLVKPSTGNVLPSAMNMFGHDDKDSEFKDFWENPVKAQDKMIAQILNEEAA